MCHQRRCNAVKIVASRCSRSEQRINLRNGPRSTCWVNVCLYKGIEARSSGYTGNPRNCCFPLIKSHSQCAGSLVTCPQRLFPVFDSCLATGFTPGAFICRKHLKSAEQDREIYSKEDYTPPKKVNKLHCFSLYFFPSHTHKFNLQVCGLSGIALIHVQW